MLNNIFLLASRCVFLHLSISNDIDFAKSVFQVCVWMVDSSVAWNRKISRQKLLDTLRQFELGTLIAVEAYSTSHFWGRTLSSMGYTVKAGAHLEKLALLMPCLRHSLETGVPASACFKYQSRTGCRH